MENSNVAATFYWCYEKGGSVYTRQVKIFIYKKYFHYTKTRIQQIRINGKAVREQPSIIQQFYKAEPLNELIRLNISKTGEPVVWNELKKKHDDTFVQISKCAASVPLQIPQNEFQ